MASTARFHVRTTVTALALLTAFLFGPSIPAARAGLLEYVKKPDPSFAWKLKGKADHNQGTVYDLHLVSQTWQGITWEHSVKTILFLLVIGGLGAGGYFYWRAQQAKPAFDANPVVTAKVERGPIKLSVSATGRVAGVERP